MATLSVGQTTSRALLPSPRPLEGPWAPHGIPCLHLAHGWGPGWWASQLEGTSLPLAPQSDCICPWGPRAPLWSGLATPQNRQVRGFQQEPGHALPCLRAAVWKSSDCRLSLPGVPQGCKRWGGADGCIPRLPAAGAPHCSWDWVPSRASSGLADSGGGNSSSTNTDPPPWHTPSFPASHTRTASSNARRPGEWQQ